MNKRQIENRIRFYDRMMANCGATEAQCDALLRAETVLHTWAEHECNGEIQRDEATDKPFWYNMSTGKKSYAAPDRETGAQNRVRKIIAEINALNPIEKQLKVKFNGDPRGGLIELLDADDRQIYLPD